MHLADSASKPFSNYCQLLHAFLMFSLSFFSFIFSLVYLNAKYIYLVSNITQWVISEWGNSKKDYSQRDKFS